MGSYCGYKLGEWEFEWSKSYVLPKLTVAFHEMDRKINYVKENGENYRKVRYTNSADNVKMRLDALGYTIKAAQAMLLKNRTPWVQENSYLLPSGIKNVKKIYLESSIDDWIEAYRLIRENNWQRPYSCSDKKWKACGITPLVKIALATEETFYGFPASPQYIFRLFLESCQKNQQVELDVSDLIYAGYYSVREKIVESVKSREKIILLTEGSTDKEFLEASLNVLFPHMVDCYSYLDFSEFSVPGGIDKLTYIVKAFAGANLPNRIVALYDNDTAGVKEFNLLKRIRLPENIKITTLPEINLAKQYPTISPSGNVIDNVNGRACGIEMYLGEDVLRDTSGNLEPVTWGGYIDPQGYQGSLQNKIAIQRRFRDKVRLAKLSKKNLKNQNWYEMNQVWKHIFSLHS